MSDRKSEGFTLFTLRIIFALLISSVLVDSEGKVNGPSIIASSYDPETIYNKLVAASYQHDKNNIGRNLDASKALFSNGDSNSFIDDTLYNFKVFPVKHRNGNPELDGILSKYNLEPHVSLVKIERKSDEQLLRDEVTETNQKENLPNTLPTRGRSVGPMQPNSRQTINIFETVNENTNTKHEIFTERTTKYSRWIPEPKIISRVQTKTEEANETLETSEMEKRSKHRRKFGRLSSLDPERREAILAKRQKLKERRRRVLNNETSRGRSHPVTLRTTPSPTAQSIRYTSRFGGTHLRSGAARLKDRRIKLRARTTTQKYSAPEVITTTEMLPTTTTRITTTTTTATEMPTSIPSIEPRQKVDIESNRNLESVVKLHPVFKRIKSENDQIKGEHITPDEIFYDELYDPAPVEPRYTKQPRVIERVTNRATSRGRQNYISSRNRNNNLSNVQFENENKNEKTFDSFPSRYLKPTIFPDFKPPRIPKPRLVNQASSVPIPRPVWMNNSPSNTRDRISLIPQPFSIGPESSIKDITNIHETLEPVVNFQSRDNFAVLDQVFRSPQVTSVSPPSRDTEYVDEIQDDFDNYSFIEENRHFHHGENTGHSGDYDYHESSYESDVAPVEYGYKVASIDTGNFQQRNEQRQGKQVKGSYQVVLPDGRIQTVTYIADDDGFRADVTYEKFEVASPTSLPSFFNTTPRPSPISPPTIPHWPSIVDMNERNRNRVSTTTRAPVLFRTNSPFNSHESSHTTFRSTDFKSTDTIKSALNHREPIITTTSNSVFPLWSSTDRPPQSFHVTTTHRPQSFRPVTVLPQLLLGPTTQKHPIFHRHHNLTPVNNRPVPQNLNNFNNFPSPRPFVEPLQDLTLDWLGPEHQSFHHNKKHSSVKPSPIKISIDEPTGIPFYPGVNFPDEPKEQSFRTKIPPTLPYFTPKNKQRKPIERHPIVSSTKSTSFFILGSAEKPKPNSPHIIHHDSHKPLNKNYFKGSRQIDFQEHITLTTPSPNPFRVTLSSSHGGRSRSRITSRGRVISDQSNEQRQLSFNNNVVINQNSQINPLNFDSFNNIHTTNQHHLTSNSRNNFPPIFRSTTARPSEYREIHNSPFEQLRSANIQLDNSRETLRRSPIFPPALPGLKKKAEVYHYKPENLSESDEKLLDSSLAQAALYNPNSHVVLKALGISHSVPLLLPVSNHNHSHSFFKRINKEESANTGSQSPFKPFTTSSFGHSGSNSTVLNPVLINSLIKR